MKRAKLNQQVGSTLPAAWYRGFGPSRGLRQGAVSGPAASQGAAKDESSRQYRRGAGGGGSLPTGGRNSSSLDEPIAGGGDWPSAAGITIVDCLGGDIPPQRGPSPLMKRVTGGGRYKSGSGGGRYQRSQTVLGSIAASVATAGPNTSAGDGPTAGLPPIPVLVRLPPRRPFMFAPRQSSSGKILLTRPLERPRFNARWGHWKYTGDFCLDLSTRLTLSAPACLI